MARTVLALGLALLLLAPAGARADSAPSALDALTIYAGTWSEKIDRLASRYSTAGSETTTLRNDCWRSGQFYACDQFLNGESKALVVYTCDAQTHVYTSHVILPSGAGSTGALIIAGATWTFPWTQKDGDKTVYMRVVNTFSGRDMILFTQEYSLDQINWTTIARGIETRVN